MSSTELQEHSYLKVLYDFQYKTTEGRQISIEKDEKLYLLQKTNKDWWQVVRNREQRSFYVPASYVREMRRNLLTTGRRTSDEDRDLKPPGSPSYENMPKECLDRAKNVEKWLAGTMESMQSSSRSSDNSSEKYGKFEMLGDATPREMKVGLDRIKKDPERMEKNEKNVKSEQSGAKEEKRGLERFRNVIKRFATSTNNTSEDSKHDKAEKSSKIIRRLSNNSKDVDEGSNASNHKLQKIFGSKDKDDNLETTSRLDNLEDKLMISKRLSSSPKESDMMCRLESSPQNLFQKELESSLERRKQRKISGGGFEYEKLAKEEHGSLERRGARKIGSIAEGTVVENAKNFSIHDTVALENSHVEHKTSSLEKNPRSESSTTAPKVRERRAISVERLRKTSGSLERSIPEELRCSLERSQVIKRHSNSSDRRSVTPENDLVSGSPCIDRGSSDGKNNVQRHTPQLLHDNHSKNRTLVSPVNMSLALSPEDVETDENADKFLNDKRKSWAIEELMSELTQMRRERVGNKKPNFELQSIEIKDDFDPIEKLTQELHEMRVQSSESGTSLVNVEDSHSRSTNVCSISVNVSSSVHDTTQPRNKREESVAEDDQQRPQNESQKTGVAAPLKPVRSSRRSAETADEQMQTAPENPFLFEKPAKCKPAPVSANIAVSPKIAKSPKSPKLLDEYNEANILNDRDDMRAIGQKGEIDTVSSLSTDKECQLSSSYQGRAKLVQLAADNFERPSYSNVSLAAEKVKLRPKLKIKAKNIGAEIKLTPSLEKLASEIQFLPANKVFVIDGTKSKTARNAGACPEDNGNVSQRESSDLGAEENLHRSSDDGLNEEEEEPEMWKKFKSKLNYKGSFKTKQEERAWVVRRDIEDPEEKSRKKSSLKKSATFHCVSVPERYAHFRREDSFMRLGLEVAARKRLKRRSRSLGDLCIPDNVIQSFENVGSSSDINKKPGKPMPSPRAKPPNVTVVSILTAEPENAKKKTAASPEGSKPIPARRKISRDKNLDMLSGSYKETKIPLNVPLSSMSRSYQNLNEDLAKLKVVDVNRSTAIGFKNLLCASDSGSDEYLHYKAFPKSSSKENEQGIFRSENKINSRAKIMSTGSLNVTDRSISDEQILSSNASSEVLLSRSGSEVNLTSEFSDNPSPVNVGDDREATENFIDLPAGWVQKFDQDTKQICFVNDRGDKVGAVLLFVYCLICSVIKDAIFLGILEFGQVTVWTKMYRFN